MGNGESANSLDLSHRDLESLGEDEGAFSRITSINLSKNKIKSLPTSMKSLEGLNLSKNSLRILPQQLCNYPKLNAIDLSYNMLKFSSQAKLVEMLSKIKKLRLLSLAGNALTCVDISNVTSLEEIDLSKNKLDRFPENLPKKIRRIDVSFNKIEELNLINKTITELRIVMNSVSLITETTRFQSLKILDVSKNDLSQMPDLNILCPHLEELDISFNYFADFPKIPSTLKKLNVSANFLIATPNFAVCTPFLEELDISKNKIERLSGVPPTIKSIVANNNKISDVQLSTTPLLTNVDMDFNCLKEMPNFVDNKIEMYTLMHNDMESINVNMIYSNIRKLVISNNCLSSVPKELFDMPQLKFLNISSNDISEIPENVKNSKLSLLICSFNPLSSFPQMPPTLKKLSCGHCDLENLPESISQNSQLNELFVSNNKLKKLPLIPSLTILRASKNRFTEFPDLSDRLVTIDLSMNEIAVMPDSMNLPELVDFDVSYNKLTRIGPSLLKSQKLRIVKFAHNPLRRAQANFSSFSHLKSVDLCGTNLSLSSASSLRSLICSSVNKFVESEVVRLVVKDNSVAYSDMRGMRDTNEDAFVIRRNPNGVSTYAIFDGHGSDIASRMSAFLYADEFSTKGSVCSDFLNSTVSFIHNKVKDISNIGGTTAAMVLVDAEEMTVGTLGDTRALIVSTNGRVVFKTRDHKPYERSELQRIKDEGGIVTKDRVSGCIGTSRAIADGQYIGVGHLAEIQTRKLQNDDKYLVIGCDGLFDRMENETVAKIVHESNGVTDAAYNLRNAAYACASLDNISVIVVDLLYNERNE